MRTNEFKFKFEKKDILKYVMRYKLHIVFILFFTLAETFISLFSPKIVGVVINEMSQVPINMDKILNIIIGLFALYSFYGVSGCLESYLSSFVSTKINYDIRKDAFDKIGRMTLACVGKSNYGDILSKIMNDIDVLASACTQGIIAIVSSSIMSVGVIIMMFSISWQMSLVSFLILPFAAVIVLIIFKKSQKYFKEYQNGLGKLNGFIEENFSEYEVIKIFDKEDNFEKKFKGLNDSMYDLSWKSKFFSGLASPMIDFISKITFVVSCVMGGYYATVSALSLGDISAFITYSGKFTQPIISAAGIMSMIQQAMAALGRIADFFNSDEETLICNSKDKFDFDKNKNYDIEFKNIKFAYDEGEQIIKDISFEVKSGQKIAVVGETGAGKTTFINILMRFYDNYEGEILLKDKENNILNIKDLNLQNYRQLFGLVTQDSWLYSDSIMENIRYGNESASDEDVMKAAEFVGVSHFINSLPEGYKTIIKESAGNISEGEKQLICMARMFLSCAPIFIMDEATSFVDVFTENQIQKSLVKIMEGKTAFVIAHRLNTIRNADIILFMEKGKILESGSHEDLMARKGKYSEMYLSQFEN